MDVNVIFKIAGIGILVSILYTILKEQKREDLATITALGGISVAMLVTLGLMARLFAEVKDVFSLY